MVDINSWSNALKEMYIERAKALQLRDRPLLAYLTKVNKFRGNAIPLVCSYGDPQNVSSSFAESQGRADVGTTQLGKFELTRTKLYNVVHIDREALLASEGDDGAFFDAKTEEIDNAIEAVSNRLAQLVYRSGWGEIGKVAAISGSTITLSQVAGIYNFAPGMRVVFSSSLNGAVLRGATQYLQVASTNAQTGVVTFTAAVSSITGGGGSVATSDYIFTSGDRQDSATPTMLVPTGLEGWAPYGGALSGDSWFGQDRTKSPLLQGVSYDGSSDAVEDALLTSASRMAEVSMSPTHAFVNYRQFNQIVKNQRIYERFVDQVTATVGFDAVRIAGVNGPLTLVPDRYCPSDRAYLIRRDEAKLFQINDGVHLVEDDKGNPLIFRPSADGWEVRISWMGNMGTNRPCAIGTVKLAVV